MYARRLHKLRAEDAVEPVLLVRLRLRLERVGVRIGRSAPSSSTRCAATIEFQKSPSAMLTRPG